MQSYNSEFEYPGQDRKRKRKKTTPDKLNNLVETMLSNFKDKQGTENLLLADHWEEIVGKELYPYIKLAELDQQGTLHVYASNSHRVTTAKWQSDKIQKAAAKWLKPGAIKSVKITANSKEF